MSNKNMVQTVENMAAEYETQPLWKEEVFPHNAYQPLTITNAQGREVYWEGFNIYFQLGLDEIPLSRCQVSLADVIITQPWVFKKRLEEYLHGGRQAEGPPMVWEWRGKLYLADGHHRSAAQLRQGRSAIQAMVHHLPDTLMRAA